MEQKRQEHTEAFWVGHKNVNFCWIFRIPKIGAGGKAITKKTKNKG